MSFIGAVIYDKPINQVIKGFGREQSNNQGMVAYTGKLDVKRITLEVRNIAYILFFPSLS